jgi:hypothetical protein
MNPAVNRSSESSPSFENQSSKSFPLSNQPEEELNEHSQTTDETNPITPQRQQPIPPPSDPKQYRAIGLIQGKYQVSEEQLTQGMLITSSGEVIEAVLLGRVISLVKNHLNLEQPHLWVVYPRTRQKDDHLHLQIVGVWEPETLDRNLTKQEASPETETAPQHGYFSIRGEIIYYSHEQETAIVKIKQSPKRELEKPKFFKLKLKGTLPDKPINHFWDLQVQLQENTLVIQEGIDIAFLPPKKKPFNNKGGGRKFPPRGGGRKFPSESRSEFRPESRPMPKGKSDRESFPSPSRPTPKPTKQPPRRDS